MRSSEGVFWHALAQIDKFEGDVHDASSDGRLAYTDTGLVVERFEHVEVEHNILVIGGASVQWQTLIGNGTATAAQPLTYYNNGNAYLSVGDSSTAPADTQTELQAVTNRLRKAMDATYPLHTDTTGTAGSKSIAYRSTYATTDANWAWNEWGLFNTVGTGGPPVTGGRMLNRAAGAGLLGTKTSAATWVFTVTLSLA
jgi:hypothetical protein